MGNASTIRQMNRKPRELNQGGTGTSAIIFSNITDEGDGAAGTLPVLCPLPSAGELASGSGTTGKSSRCQLRAWGRVTGGTTTNYTATLYYGTSLTASSNTVIEASTARAVDSANHMWTIEVDFMVDAVADKLQGFGQSSVANLYDAEAALDNIPTSVDVTGNATLGFAVAGTFSTGNASNTAHLDGFTLETL